MVKNFSSDPGITAMILNSAKGRENELFTLGGNEANCIPSVSRDYDGFVLNSACFTGFLANTVFEFSKAGRITDAYMIQDYMNSIVVDIFGLDLDDFLIGTKQIMVELGIFNSAKTLQDEQVSGKFLKRIKRIIHEEKDILLPEVKPQSEG